jgi:hypothetical protein
MYECTTGACSQEHLLHRTQRWPVPQRSPACKNSLSARAESHGRSSHGCPPGLAGIHRAEGGSMSRSGNQLGPGLGRLAVLALTNTGDIDQLS